MRGGGETKTVVGGVVDAVEALAKKASRVGINCLINTKQTKGTYRKV